MIGINFEFMPSSLNTLNKNTKITEKKLKEIIKQLKQSIGIKRDNSDNTAIEIIRESRNPTPTDIYKIGTVWINMATGEVFICVDIKNGFSKWAGSFGTVIEHSTEYVVDFFGDNSIIAFYRFNYNTYDETGLYNGFKTGTARFSKGRFDQALDFGRMLNNTNAFIVKNIQLTPQMNFSFWVYKYSNNIFNPYISLAYKDIYNGILLYENENYFKIIISNKIYVFYNSEYIPTKEWVFISMNVDSINKTVQLYINSEFIDEIFFFDSELDVKEISLNNCLVFGQDQDTYCGGFQITQSFLGKLDQYRIFSRLLSPKEISALYHEEP